MSWKIVKIGSVLKQYRIEHWVQNDKMYKQVSILNNGSVVLRGEKIGKEIGRKRQFIIDTDKYPKTLIFTRQLLLQGSIGIASSDVNGCIVTENMPMFAIEGIEIDFLTFFIRTELFKSQVRSLETSGTAQKSLHERQFLDLEIPLPTLKEQKKIIALCKLGNNNFEKINEEISQQQFFLQQLRQAVLQEAVQGKLTQQNKDDEPAEKLLKRIKAEKQKLIAAGKLKKEKELFGMAQKKLFFYLPNGWVDCRLGDICQVITDGTHHTPNYISEGIPFISVKNLSKGVLDFSETKFISLKEHNELIKRCNPEIGDVLLTKVGTTGIAKVIDVDNPFSIFVSVALLKFNQDLIFNKFLELLINSPIVKKQSKEGTEGIGNKNLVLRKINGFIIPLPPLAEQHRIVTKVQQLLQMTNELEQQVAHSQIQAQQLLQAVLKEAFTKKAVLYAENELLTLAAEE